MSGGVVSRDPPPVLKRIMLAMTPSQEKHMLTVTMGDPAEVVATTPVVGTVMMTAMVMMATIVAMMVMMRRDGDAAVEGNTCEILYLLETESVSAARGVFVKGAARGARGFVRLSVVLVVG